MDQFLLCLQDLQKGVTSIRKLSLIHSPGSTYTWVVSNNLCICHFLSTEMLGAQGRMLNDAGEQDHPDSEASWGFFLAIWACADTAPPTPQHSHYVWNRTELLALDPSRVDYLLGK